MNDTDVAADQGNSKRRNVSMVGSFNKTVSTSEAHQLAAVSCNVCMTEVLVFVPKSCPKPIFPQRRLSGSMFSVRFVVFQICPASVASGRESTPATHRINSNEPILYIPFHPRAVQATSRIPSQLCWFPWLNTHEHKKIRLILMGLHKPEAHDASLSRDQGLNFLGP